MPLVAERKEREAAYSAVGGLLARESAYAPAIRTQGFLSLVSLSLSGSRMRADELLRARTTKSLDPLKGHRSARQG